MTQLEKILEQAKSLTAPDFEELMQALRLFGPDRQDEGDVAVGRRGLAALTESTRHEDWSAFYADELRNGA